MRSKATQGVLSGNRADRCWGLNRRVNRLRSNAAIDAKHSAEPCPTCDSADDGLGTPIGFNQPVVEPLVISLRVVLSGELPRRLPKRLFAEEDPPIEAFLFDRSYESLSMRVQIRRSKGQAQR